MTESLFPLTQSGTQRQYKSSQFHELDLKKWKSANEIITDSLWILGERDKSGAHNGEYHGNFIPQIPHQVMLRYTKKGDVVLDTFLGSGTTLIECKRLGRHGIGIELLPEIAERAKKQVELEENGFSVTTKIISGDSREKETASKVSDTLKGIGKKTTQLIIMHPPYHDIIKFSKNPKDLSNTKTVEEFLSSFKDIVNNFKELLDKGRHLILVIGDKYSKGEWIPLGFYTMNCVKECGFKLKSIVVKNMEGNRAKINKQNLWRYRALVGGFYIFKHEYIMVFTKDK